MGTFRFIIALLLAKLVSLILYITPARYSDMPGRIALSICPDYLSRVKAPNKIIGVTGTNGKTLVAGLMGDCMTALEIHVLNNSQGSDGPAGIAATLTRGSSLFGRNKYETAVLKIDPMSVGSIFPFLEPDILLVTNLSRGDTLREAHPEYVGQVLTSFMPVKTKLVLNGDDLIASRIAPINSKKFFGIAEMAGEKHQNANLIDDCPICPECHTRLEYEYNRYSNIGKAYCPNCNFKSPICDYVGEIIVDSGKDVSRKPGRYLKVTSATKNETFPILNYSMFNVYNQLAAIATLVEMNVRIVDIKNAFGKIDLDNSGYEVRKAGTIMVNTLKTKARDAFGTSRALEIVVGEPGVKEVVLINNSLDDEKLWSENISWLYDCDFELLNDNKIKKIVIGGDRAIDFKLRLLLAGVPEEKIIRVNEYDEVADALDYFRHDNIFIIHSNEPSKFGEDLTAQIVEKAKAKESGGAGYEN